MQLWKGKCYCETLHLNQGDGQRESYCGKGHLEELKEILRIAVLIPSTPVTHFQISTRQC